MEFRRVLFRSQATPRIALSHNFGEALSLHASVSSGFSPPSSSEIKNLDGSINRAIKAEKGLNYEINAKGNVLHDRRSVVKGTSVAVRVDLCGRRFIKKKKKKNE